MSILKPADFYYGAFLSALLNYAEKKPSLFDQTSSRRIYKLTTENSVDDYIIYTKYVSSKKNKTDRFDHWIFNFSDDEIKTLFELNESSHNVKLALICAKDNLKDGEIALLDYETAMECIGTNKGIQTHRINIKAVDNKHGLRMYGSGRSDMLDGQDNTVIVPRDALKQL